MVFRDRVVPEDAYLSIARAYLAGLKDPLGTPFTQMSTPRNVKDALIKSIFTV